MKAINENDVENAALELLGDLGYTIALGPNIDPDSASRERTSYSEVLLTDRLRKAFKKLNPHLSEDIWEEVLRKLIQIDTPSLINENHRLHRYLVEGVPIESRREDGTIRGDSARLIDYDNAESNDWLAVNQLTVIENAHKRRADIVIFVNGIPLVVIELKNPGDETATLEEAFNQIQTYKQEIPSLFRNNAMLMTSDGLHARLGSLTANFERFMPWKTVDGSTTAQKGEPELETMIKGIFEKRRFLSLIRSFIVFADTGSEISKIIAGYHQFHAVRRAVGSTLRALSGLDQSLRGNPAQYGLPPDSPTNPGDKRIGVIWHTQGSGKSFLMAFYAGQIISHPAMENPTVVVITDRNDLDDQLFSTFSMCRDLLRQTPQKAESREDLQKLLSRSSGGVVFTTIQKFAPENRQEKYPLLTNRSNVIVIADEAHRSQYGFRAKVAQKTGKLSYGFAKYLHDALPNASFIGFTATPVEKTDVNTPAVFGEYIDIYDINQGVEDAATVPIYYESRLARVQLDDEKMSTIDDDVADLGEDDDSDEQLKRKWASIEAIVGAEQRLRLIAKDLVEHFEDRLVSLNGKAMVVCMSRRICIALYNEIARLRPDWHADADDKGEIKVVMTGAASDPLEWQPHIGGKVRKKLLAKRTKDPNDGLKIVIVCDMWLTGFDAPCIHTMYVDKPMRGHGLMQAIARVNRVFRDKPGGLIVDYIGIAQNLKSALRDYSNDNQKHAGIDTAKAVELLMEKFEIVKNMFHGFDYRKGLYGSNKDRLKILARAIEWILDMQARDSSRETTKDGKKNARRRFNDAVLALTKSFALVSSSDEARQIREEVGFFQTIRAALVKSKPSSGKSNAERDLAVQQIVSGAVTSTEIIDILKATGIESPDISILSDEFLAEIQKMEKKNLAAEALRKLINGELRSKSRINIVQTRAFSERLQNAIARYHANAITAVEVLQELIDLAREIRDAHRRGEESGLSEEEIAFYDALSENKSAVEVMGNDHLCVIAQELLNGLKNNVSVDWQRQKSARARMRVLVKRILKKHGYPPDLQDDAVKTVLQQAEAFCTSWDI
ncbi:MAG: type I restriction endonuclease subunit R [Gammaproteobacteria bacterium]|nr:type I restriction endonuclease subunit R [Gammaproteobacteria bacterium]